MKQPTSSPPPPPHTHTIPPHPPATPAGNSTYYPTAFNDVYSNVTRDVALDMDVLANDNRCTSKPASYDNAAISIGGPLSPAWAGTLTLGGSKVCIGGSWRKLGEAGGSWGKLGCSLEGGSR